MLYWIDADVLIQASNRHYPFHRVPKFWSFLDEKMESGEIRASRMVYEEVVAGNDELAKWCRQRKDRGLCVRADREVQRCYSGIAGYVHANHKPHLAADFLKGADAWVIAHALTSDGTVVTEESDRSRKSKVKVPTMCRQFSAKCMNTFQMLEDLDARF